MTANFWELQRRARNKTVVYLTIFVLLTLGIAVVLEIIMRNASPDSYQPDFPLVGGAFLGITLGVALFQYTMFQSFGGKYVAESMRARRVLPNTKDPKEQQLLNIVEEIAIASALPVPPVYLIPARQINAFAAGLTPDKAVIAVSQGALQKLDREELQGVVAHEFGHIYNRDMRISMQLAAMVMGFFFVLYLALRLFQFSGLFGGGRNREQGERRGGNPMAMAALLLVAAGAITWFVGSILKAMVSRQREYLADACSIQFTRNPEGIARALKKISQEQINDMPKEGMSYSHMYLDSHIGFNALFATHPPLEKRIQAILGLEYLPQEWKVGLTAQKN